MNPNTSSTDENPANDETSDPLGPITNITQNLVSVNVPVELDRTLIKDDAKPHNAIDSTSSLPIRSSKSLSQLSTNENNKVSFEGSDAKKGILPAISSKRSLFGFHHSKVHPAPNNNNSPESIKPSEKEELCLLKTVVPIDGMLEESGTQQELITNLINDLNNGSTKEGKDEEGGGNHTPMRCVSDSDSMEGFCRICHDNPSKLTLISPCSCKGSVGLVHRQCLERWLGESGKQNCEICNMDYNTERRARYTGITSFFRWIKSPLAPNDTRNLFFDLICFFILTPLSAVSAWLCIVGAQEYAAMKDNEMSGRRHSRRSKGFWRNTHQNDPANNTWTSVGLLTLTGTLLAAYYVWLVVAIKYHVQVWRDWQQHNFVVTIIPAQTASNENPDRNNNAHDQNGLNSSSNRCSTVIVPSHDRRSVNNNNNDVSAGRLNSSGRLKDKFKKSNHDGTFHSLSFTNECDLLFAVDEDGTSTSSSSSSSSSSPDEIIVPGSRKKSFQNRPKKDANAEAETHLTHSAPAIIAYENSINSNEIASTGSCSSNNNVPGIVGTTDC